MFSVSRCAFELAPLGMTPPAQLEAVPQFPEAFAVQLPVRPPAPVGTTASIADEPTANPCDDNGVTKYSPLACLSAALVCCAIQAEVISPSDEMLVQFAAAHGEKSRPWSRL